MLPKMHPKSFRFQEEDVALIQRLKRKLKLRKDVHVLRHCLKTTLEELMAKNPDTIDSITEELGVFPGDMCPEHNQTYFSCWKRHG